jgi:HNH endonuclease
MNTLQGFSHEFLSSLFIYRPKDGTLIRRVAVGGRGIKCYAGSVVGSLDGKGYLHVMVRGKFIRLHRLIYFLIYKTTPVLVDHRDGNRTNNRVGNLRDATISLNNANVIGLHAHNTSGFRGVWKAAKRRRWNAVLKWKGVHQFLGSYDTKKEAARAYDDAAVKYFGEFARLNDAR